MVVQFRLPTPSSTAVTNLLGVAGLVAIVIAVGMLVGLAWGMIAFGLISVAIATLAQTFQPQAAPAAVPVSDLDAARQRKAA